MMNSALNVAPVSQILIKQHAQRVSDSPSAVLTFTNLQELPVATVVFVAVFTISEAEHHFRLGSAWPRFCG